jgi:hypothetical protein
MAPPARQAAAALGFALAGLFASWSPLAAPFGLLTGLGAAVLAWRARRDGGRLARLALGLALLATAGSGWVLARTAGLGRDLHDATPLPSASDRATSARLDAAAAESRVERRRAEEQASPATNSGPRN